MYSRLLFKCSPLAVFFSLIVPHSLSFSLAPLYPSSKNRFVGWGWNIAVNYRGNVECASVFLSPSLSRSPDMSLRLANARARSFLSPPNACVLSLFHALLRIHRQWHGPPHSSYLHSFNATCGPWNVRANPSTRALSVPDLRYRLSPFPFHSTPLVEFPQKRSTDSSRGAVPNPRAMYPRRVSFSMIRIPV